MSKTHTLTGQILSALTTAFLTAGIGVVVVSTGEFVQASTIGPGTTVTVQTSSSKYQPTLHVSSAATVQENAELRLILGMLLVLAGFGFHALTLVRGKAHSASRGRGRSKLVYGMQRVFYRRLV